VHRKAGGIGPKVSRNPVIDGQAATCPISILHVGQAHKEVNKV